MKTVITTLCATLSTLTLAAGLPMASQAQTGVLHRHPTASAVGAGLIAHHMAAKGASKSAAAEKKPSFVQRHPVATGIAAGAVTHHMLTKH